MKALVQRVTSASVTVDGKVINSVGRGMCVLLGISRKDTPQELEWMAKKLLNLRIFPDPLTNKQWEKSVIDLGLEILCISQFTLCHVLKGNKPDFHNALGSHLSSPMYDEFMRQLGIVYRSEAIKGN
jgi:D-tyrosyl-tRNA(Tyr) deacylase